MALTELADVQDQIQTFWSPIFVAELIESNPLLALVNRDYEGEIKVGGDTVRVSQIKRPAGETKTIGAAGDNEFTPEKLQTAKVDVKAEKRFVASFEFEDLVDLQSQIGSQDSAIRNALIESINIQINEYLYSLVAPAANHIIDNTATMTAAVLSSVRRLAGKAKWAKTGGWYGLLSPDYYGDIMDETKLTSTDFVEDRPVVGGEVVTRRYGFNIIEDNSDGNASLSADDKAGLFFHPDFMYFVMQMMPRFKVSDQHSNNKFGYTISVDSIGGAKIGLEGDVKHAIVIGEEL
jgi:hypothetical protein